MESKLSHVRRRAEDAAWSISTATRQSARDADACIASDDWLYAAPVPPTPVAPRPIGTPTPKR